MASDEFSRFAERTQLFPRGRRTTRPRGKRQKPLFYAERRERGLGREGRRAEGTIEAEVGFPVGGEPPVVRGVVGSSTTSVTYCDDVVLANGSREGREKRAVLSS